jgi:peptidylprolyl isomerase
MRRIVLALACALPLLAAGCGLDINVPDAPEIEKTVFAPALGVDLTAMTKTSTGLYYRDLSVGTGAEVTVGKKAAVHYTGWLVNGTKFDENGAGQTPYSFVAGARAVIDGFDQGVIGMKAGGKRQLVIPPALGYGSQAYGPIPGNSILVFQVEVVSAQ